MEQSNYNIDVFKGDSKTIILTLKKDTESVDATGWDWFFTVKKSKTDPNDDDTDSVAIIKKDTSDFILALDTSGTYAFTVVTLSLTDADNEIDALEYYYDIQYKESPTSTLTPVYGTYTVNESITRRSV